MKGLSKNAKTALALALMLSAAAHIHAEKEKIVFRTGMTAGMTVENPYRVIDSFIPLSFIGTGGKCHVTSIRKLDAQEMWCMTLTVESAEQKSAEPVSFDFYIKRGSTIFMRRLLMPMSACEMRVTSVDWNTVTFEIE